MRAEEVDQEDQQLHPVDVARPDHANLTTTGAPIEAPSALEAGHSATLGMIMNKSFPEAITWAASRSPIGTIVDIGAGSGEILRIPAVASAQHILLVEPNPLHLSGLRKLSAGDDRISILPVAVADFAGEAVLRQFNFPALASIQAPSETLMRLLPGLRQTKQQDVDALPLATILAESLPLENAQADASNILIIEANGAELDIVRDLLASDHSSHFAYIFLHAGRDAAYQDTLPLSEAQTLLEAAGYQLSCQDEGDPDFPWLVFMLDQVALQLLDLRQQVAKRDEAQESDRKRLADLNKQLESSKTESRSRSQRVEELKKEIAAQADRHGAIETQLVEREQRIEDLNKEIAALTGKQATIEAQLIERDQQIASLQDQAAEQAKTQDAERQQVRDLTKQLETAKAESQGRSKRVEDLKKEIAALADNQTTIDTQLIERDQQIASLQEQAAKLAEAQDAERQQNRELAGQLETAKTESRGRSKRIEDLKKEIAALTDNQSAIEAQRTEREQQIASLRDQAAEQAKSLSAAQQRIAELTKQLETTRGESRGRSERVEDLKKTVAALSEKQTSMSVDLAARDKQIALLQSQAIDQAKTHEADRLYSRELMQQLEVIQAESADRASCIDDLGKQLNAAKSESRDRSQRVEDLKKENDSLLEKQRAAQAEIETASAAQKADGKKIDTLASQLDQAKAESRSRAERVEDLKREIAEMQVTAKAHLADRDQQLRALKAKVEDLTKARDADRLKIEERNVHLDSVKAESRQRAERVEELKRDNAALQDQQIAAEASLAERDQQCILLQLQIEELELLLGNTRQDNLDQAGQIEALRQEKDELLDRQSATESGLTERHEQLSQLQARYDDQAKARNADREKIDELGKQLDSVKAESRGRSLRVEDLKKEAGGLRDELAQLRSEWSMAIKKEQNVRDSLLRAEAQLALMKDLIGLQTRPDIVAPGKQRIGSKRLPKSTVPAQP